MKLLLLGIIAFLVIAISAIVAVIVFNGDNFARLTQSEDRGDFVISFENRESPYYAVHSLLFTRSHTFEELAKNLNEVISLPHDVPIYFDVCNEANAFYDSRAKSITLCYELIDLIGKTLERKLQDVLPDVTESMVDNEVRNVTEFIMLHEVAHALIDILDIPITGREEDAADQLAALILTKLGEEKQLSILSTAFFQSQEAQKLFSDEEFADVHSLNPQRSFGLLCLMYGSNPFMFVELVSGGILPASRAKSCGEEFQQVDKSWSALLTPHFNPGVVD